MITGSCGKMEAPSCSMHYRLVDGDGLAAITSSRHYRQARNSLRRHCSTCFMVYSYIYNALTSASDTPSIQTIFKGTRKSTTLDARSSNRCEPRLYHHSDFSPSKQLIRR